MAAGVTQGIVGAATTKAVDGRQYFAAGTGDSTMGQTGLRASVGEQLRVFIFYKP